MRLLIGLLLVSLGSLPGAPSSRYAELTLTNHLGGSFKLENFSDRYLFLTFFYRRCPVQKMCPLSIHLSKKLADQSKNLAPTNLRVVGITLDPSHDTPKRLADYVKLERIDSNTFWLAVGTPQAIDVITSEFNVIGIANGSVSVSHNIRSVLLGPGLKFLKNFNENEWQPEDVLKTIRAALAKTT